jgi:hypothetical protein
MCPAYEKHEADQVEDPHKDAKRAQDLQQGSVGLKRVK